MKIVSVARKSNLTGEGLHLGTIQSLVECDSSAGTPQLQMTVVAEDKSTRNHWFNLLAFKKNSKGDYIDAKGRRIEWDSFPSGSDERIAALKKRVKDDDKTQICFDILGQFVNDMGFKDDPDTDELVGQKCFIVVKGNGSDGRITHIFNSDNQEMAEKYASKELGYAVSYADDEVQSI